jgi:hypothetical protein
VKPITDDQALRHGLRALATDRDISMRQTIFSALCDACGRHRTARVSDIYFEDCADPAWLVDRVLFQMGRQCACRVQPK